MRDAPTWIACLVLCGLAGCASGPRKPPTESANGVSAVPDTVQQRAAVDAAIRAGYHPTSIHGQTLYCREETPIGTRFSERHCYTIAQLTASQRDRDALHDMLAKPRTCGGSICVAQ